MLRCACLLKAYFMTIILLSIPVYVSHKKLDFHEWKIDWLKTWKKFSVRKKWVRSKKCLDFVNDNDNDGDSYETIVRKKYVVPSNPQIHNNRF